MATSLKNLSDYDPNQIPNAEDMTFGIVVSEYNQEVTFALRDGCVKTLLKHGAKENNVMVYHVPGAFELVSASAYIVKKLNIDAIISLGCVIKGETKHDQYINTAVANGISDLNVQFNVPVIFGLLTVNDQQQALDRAGGKHGNKGVECAIAAIKMAGTFRHIQDISPEF